MLRRILVPLDGSRFAEVAVPVAARLAELAHAELRLTLVRELGMSQALTAERVAAGEPPVSEAAYLADVIARRGLGSHVETDACVVDGVVSPTLVELIQSRHPDLVVMATHGRGSLARLWFGSVADYLVRHVSVPLLLLRPKDESDRTAEDLRLGSILAPLDLSATGEAILEPVAELAALHAASIELMHVIQPLSSVPAPGLPPRLFDPDFADRERDRAETHLARVAFALREKGLVVKTRVVFAADIAKTLLDAAEQAGHDLVALATQGAGGVERALLGSVADQVIRGSEKPVLVVRPAR